MTDVNYYVYSGAYLEIDRSGSKKITNFTDRFCQTNGCRKKPIKEGRFCPQCGKETVVRISRTEEKYDTNHIPDKFHNAFFHYGLIGDTQDIQLWIPSKSNSLGFGIKIDTNGNSGLYQKEEDIDIAKNKTNLCNFLKENFNMDEIFGKEKWIVKWGIISLAW